MRRGARPRRPVRRSGSGGVAGARMTRPSRSSFCEVREDGQPRDRVERRGDLAVHAGDDVRHGLGAGADGGEDLGLALEPVGDVALDDRPGGLEDRPVRRVDALDVQLQDPPERREVVAEVAVVGRDDVVEPPRMRSPVKSARSSSR